jgi:tRNA/tmRNA/rRNA uracil-C5-methylase (TrmA/RlmC/RlmD family)
MLDLMLYLVMDVATRESPTTSGAMTHLIDCYCGSGLFCIVSSLHFDVYVGIKVNKMAISEARKNAASNGISNYNFVAMSAKGIFLSEVPVGVGGQPTKAERTTTMMTKRREVACWWGISPRIQRWFWLSLRARGA